MTHWAIIKWIAIAIHKNWRTKRPWPYINTIKLSGEEQEAQKAINLYKCYKLSSEEQDDPVSYIVTKTLKTKKMTQPVEPLYPKVKNRKTITLYLI